MDSGDTAQRSLEHWSELGRGEMEKFYALATEDYRQLALAADWTALLGERAHQGWSLLDVACGSGKFPTALLRYTEVASLPGVAYDLLDPSAFSIATARADLAAPFVPRNDLVMPLQELPSSCGPYDVVWAPHPPYALRPTNSTPPWRVLRRPWPREGWGSSLRRRAARTTCRSMTPIGPGCVTRLLTPRPRWWRLPCAPRAWTSMSR